MGIIRIAMLAVLALALVGWVSTVGTHTAVVDGVHFVSVVASFASKEFSKLTSAH